MLSWIITSSILVLTVILLRTVFNGKIDPRIQYALWIVVLIRLLVPFNFHTSNISVLNTVDTKTVEEAEVPVSRKVYFDSESESAYQKAYMEFYDVDASEVPARDDFKTTAYLQKTMNVGEILQSVVVSGMILTLIIFAVSNTVFYFRLRRKRKVFKAYAPKIYTVPELSSPCLFFGEIYIRESDIEDRDKLEYIIAHEITHYRHLDHIWSLASTLALCIHWYNPLVWIAFKLSKRDSELACDLGVIRKLGEERRIEYGETILDMLAERCPGKNMLCCATTMNSGKRGIRERIKMIAKTPKMISIGLIAVLLLMFAASCGTFTNAKTSLNSMQYESMVREYELFDSDLKPESIYEKYGQVERFVNFDILGTSDKDGKTEVYAELYDVFFTCFRGDVYDGGGSGGYSDFCVLTVEIIDENNVQVTDVWYPDSGSEYWSSIRKRVPLGIQLQHKLRNKTKTADEVKKQAQEYFGAPHSDKVLNIFHDETTNNDIYEIWSVNSTEKIEKEESGVLGGESIKEFQILKDFHNNPDKYTACRIDAKGYCENPEVWNEFYEQTQKQVDCNVIIYMHTMEGDPIYLYLSYKNGKYTVYEDDSFDEFGDETDYYVRKFEYLLKDNNNGDTVYLLSSKPDLTYKELFDSYLSSQSNAINGMVIITTK